MCKALRRFSLVLPFPVIIIKGNIAVWHNKKKALESSIL
jgi:hypothetical protein